MSDQQLRTHLEDLHTVLKSHTTFDDSETALLAALKDDIAEIISNKEAQDYKDFPSFTKRLEESVEKFEISHPTLTTALNNVIATLNNSGI